MSTESIESVKMNPEVKSKWVRELRSGRYLQGTGQLVYIRGVGGYAYCCLGVLTDLYHKETGKGEWLADTCAGFDFVDHTDEGTRIKGSCDLPRTVGEWAGINPHGKEANHLVGMNDNAHNDFNEIADWIEENL